MTTIMQWRQEDEDSWYGWDLALGESIHEREADYLVKYIHEDGIWAGWSLTLDGSQEQCITADYPSASQARNAVSAQI